MAAEVPGHNQLILVAGLQRLYDASPPTAQ